MSENVISLVPKGPKEEEVFDIHIVFIDGTKEVVEAESFAETTDLSNFMVAWDDSPSYVLKGFWNLKNIRSIKILPKLVEVEDAYFG